MRASTLSLAALAAPLVSAIAFTSPAENSTVTKGAEYELTWSSVDTDPSVFSIYLVNFVDWPPYYTPLALDIETGLGAYTVRVPCEAATSYGFQFNAINGTNVYVIYAQTPKFFIDGDACTDPPLSTCAAATVTVTVSTTLSSASATSTSYSASGNGTATYSRTSASSTATWSSNPPADHTTTSHHHPKPTSGGKCPDTIGWGSSGYSHPVTLTQAPTPPGAASTDYASTEVVYTTVYQEWQGQCHC